MESEFNIPTRVVHGPGCVDRLGAELPAALDRVLIVTDAGLAGHGVPERLGKLLSGRKVEVFSEVEPNPSF